MTSYSRRESGSRLESSKYEVGGTESSALSRIESKYSRTEGGSKYGIESSTESSYDSASKLDSIASKYGIETNGSKVEGRSSRYSLETSLDGDRIEGASSTTESRYESIRNGGASTESNYSKIANGSVSTGEYTSARSISKSESQDGKPSFSKTLEGQNIERKSHTTVASRPTL